MYADRVTNSMQQAIDETDRRRVKQVAYNEDHQIQPRTIVKEITAMVTQVKGEENGTAVPTLGESELTYETADLFTRINELEMEMQTAATNLEFERAASLRDQIVTLRKQLEPV